jgi:hypothetical protein
MLPPDQDAFDDGPDELVSGPLPPISPGFVDRTLERIVADLAEIRAEAEVVDRDPLPRALLDAWQVPPSSPDFVARTAAAIAADRAARGADWQRMLHSYTVPAISADFVARTLDALGATPRARARRTPSRRLLVAAAAAVLIVAIGLVMVLSGSRRPPRPRIEGTSAHDFSPAFWSTAASRAAERGRPGVRLEPVDPLVVMARHAGGR